MGNSAITVAEKAEEGMEILDEKTADSRERIAGVREESAERIAKQLKELEEKRDAIRKAFRRMLNID